MNTFNVVARTRANKQGLHPLCFVATLNRKSVYRSLGFSIALSDWDSQNQRLTKKSDIINFRLNQLKTKAADIALRLRVENKEVMPSDFIEMVFGDKQKASGSDFYVFVDQFLKQKEYGTHAKAYNTLKDNLQAFSKYATFKDIDYNFCVSFTNFLRSEYKNGNNTRLKKLQYLRCILNEAVKHKHIDRNPATEVKITPDKTNREALIKHELLKLEELYQKNTLPHNRQNVLGYFLFCCYTGLRFGDLVKFKKTDIKGDFIKIQQSKTKGVVSIPLNPKALALIPEDNFQVLSNQKTNAHLKEIQNALNLKTKLTCHVARHTFATIAINMGVPIVVVSDVLGHTRISTTQIYAKLSDKYRLEQMAKTWT